MLELIGEIIQLMCHFMNSFYVLAYLIFLPWICKILNSFLWNHLFTFVFFTLDIWVIQVCVVLRLSQLLICLCWCLCLCFCLYCRVVCWFDSWIWLFRSLVFGFIHLRQIQRIVHGSVHFRSYRYLTSYKNQFTSLNHIHPQSILRNEFSYRLLCLWQDISAEQNIIRPLNLS